MITLYRASFQTAERAMEFCGISTDEKPVDTKNTLIPNGSVFYEIDTQTTYRYDAENKEWIVQ